MKFTFRSFHFPALPWIAWATSPLLLLINTINVRDFTAFIYVFLKPRVALKVMKCNKSIAVQISCSLNLLQSSLLYQPHIQTWQYVTAPPPSPPKKKTKPKRFSTKSKIDKKYHCYTQQKLTAIPISFQNQQNLVTKGLVDLYRTAKKVESFHVRTILPSGKRNHKLQRDALFSPFFHSIYF